MANKEIDKYDVLEKIGQGSFGIIRKVRRRDTGQILCRKEISYTRMSEKEKEQLYAELKILESLKHPNIVQYCHREHIKSCNDLHLYMEYCGNGDLGGYIKKLKDRNQWADEEFVWTIFAQLIGALYRCHYGEDPPEPGNEAVVRKGKTLQTKEGHRMILHRDLKPENVFLSQNNAVKLGDFGLSKIIASHDFASTYVGTPFYMSPEICAAERYSHHSDVWSLGCIIYELASRCVPFDARSHVELVMKIKAGRLKSLPAHYSPELTEVISWCLKVDPRGRPDTAQLLNVTQIKLARARLEQASKLERAQHEFLKMQNERDTALARLQPVQKQVQELQKQVASLQEAEKKIEMEWHTRATLAIDQRVSEEVERLKLDFEKQLAGLRQQDTAKVEKRVQEELRLHYASLPSSHGASQGPDVAVHVRSCTPPPGKHTASFATTATTGVESDGSSIMPDGDALETDMSSLSMMEQELGDDVSPLAQRTKPRKAPRQAFGRAKTFAHGHFTTTDSPMDVHMADPSPMPSHIAPMSNIKGLSLSPRRTGQERLSNCARGKNIFSLAAEQKLRPTVGNEHPSFADDDSDDCEDILEDSPSRTSSRLSNISSHGDPFKALGTTKQPLKRARPSLGRQQTMPVSMQQNTTGRAKAPLIPARGLKRSPEKENRPPSSYGRSNVPVINASPKRGAAAAKEKKDLTPNRKAPAPPAHGPGLARLAHANNMQSPGRVKGRTLLELQQGRLGPDSDAEGSTIMASAPKLLPSPAKWDSMDEDMPSPFLAKKGRTMIR